MTTKSKKPGVAFWATAALVTILLYVLSAPPLQHWILPADPPAWAIDLFSVIYWPAAWLIERSPEPIQEAFVWYASAWRKFGLTSPFR